MNGLGHSGDAPLSLTTYRLYRSTHCTADYEHLKSSHLLLLQPQYETTAWYLAENH